MITEVETALLLKKIHNDLQDEERLFLRDQRLVDHHREAELDRLVFLGAFRAAVNPVLEKYLKHPFQKHILEVGCGTGFFSRHLAPSWLEKPRQ